MMNLKTIQSSITSLLILFSISIIQAQSAKDIISKANALMQGETSQGTMKMEIVRPTWSREMTMKSWAIGNDYSLVIVTSPARDKGVGFLKREKELWNWQPRIDRVIKMPPSMMSQSWMGSDFTNDDLVRESSIVKDYDHLLVKDTTVNDYPVWRIDLIPKEDAPVVWGKIQVYIAKEYYYQLLVKYFDEDGYLVNTMYMTEIKQMGDRKIPTRMEMIPADHPNQKTVVTYLNFEYNKPIDESFFSVQNLKRVR